MDIASSTAPRTDQQNFDNYLAGPKTVTISEVKAGTEEQPIELHLVEFPGQPYKPSRSMRRVLMAAWGSDGSAFAGRRITLYGDPSVRFGSAVVGGLKISHLSHIEKPLTVALTVSRGKRAPFSVKPLPATAPARDWQADIDAATDTDTLTAIYTAARATPGAYTDELKQAFGVRGAAIKATEAA